MQYSIIGNQFQLHMQEKFKMDMNLLPAIKSSIRGRENLVYSYIIDIASLIQHNMYGFGENPRGFYSDYDAFAKHFVRYWRNALNLPREDSDKLRAVFDEQLSNTVSCKNQNAISVFFVNSDKALTVEDCLYAVYEVLKMA